MIRAIVTDIEGTTSSISFVHEVLFPYAAKHMGGFVRSQRHQPEVAAQLDEVARLGELDVQDVEAQIALLSQWMAEDRKITPLKALQGMIWKYGYEQGHFKGHVYPDAVDRLREWHDQGLRLYVYSSGSVQAQKLIFGYTEFGDLTPLFSGYFDTNIGGKREVESYRNILAELDLAGHEVLFLSDIQEELNAAQEAGLQVYWLVREGSLPQGAPYPAVSDFTSIQLN